VNWQAVLAFIEAEAAVLGPPAAIALLQSLAKTTKNPIALAAINGAIQVLTELEAHTPASIPTSAPTTTDSL
jgi:hypothetical protein